MQYAIGNMYKDRKILTRSVKYTTMCMDSGANAIARRDV